MELAPRTRVCRWLVTAIVGTVAIVIVHPTPVNFDSGRYASEMAGIELRVQLQVLYMDTTGGSQITRQGMGYYLGNL